MAEITHPVTIAFVVSRLGVGGAERQLVSLVNALDRERFRPLVVCLKDPGELSDLLASGTRTVSLGVMNGGDPRVVTRLCAVLAEHDVRLVHCTNFNATLWGRAAARRLGIPHVTAEHSTNRLRVRERALVRLGNAMFDRGTSAVVACAQAQVPVLVREGCGRNHTVVIHNGVALEAFEGNGSRDAVRARLGMAPDDVMVLVLASLSPQKNHVLLVRAAARAIAAGAPLRLVLAGEGEMRHEIERVRSELGLGDRVSLLGVRSDAADLLAACDLASLTSVTEAFPMCLLEAMAARKPVVATRVGGVGEMVHEGMNGLLVESGDEAALTERLIRLSGDVQLRERMGRAGRTIVEQDYSLAAMTQRYEGLFDSILQSEMEVGR